MDGPHTVTQPTIPSTFSQVQGANYVEPHGTESYIKAWLRNRNEDISEVITFYA